MRWAITRRMPPALSAPASPKKIVQSAASIFSQIRRAVARLRAWKDTRSMRASSSSTPRFASTVTGSTGTRRKGDFLSMPPHMVRHERAKPGKPAVSERAADPPEHGDAVGTVEAVTAHGHAAGYGQRQRVSENGVRRQLGAGGDAGVVGTERLV